MPAPDLAYRQNEMITVTDADLAEWHIANGGGLTASGSCPACGHPTSKDIYLDVVSAAAAASEPAVPPEERTTRRIACACTVEHPGRPKTVIGGCGRWWLVTLTRDNGSWLIHAGGDQSLLPALNALDEATSDELTSVRATAGKWLPGITALYGLFGLAGVLVGKTSVQGLPTPGKVAVAAAVALGLASTIAAVLFGYRAAYGWAKVADVADDQKLNEWYRQRRTAALTAPRQLRLAICFSLAAVVLLLVGVGALWFWPTASATPPTVKVTYQATVKVTYQAETSGRATQFVCKILVNLSGNGVEVQPTNGSASTTVVITTPEIKSIASGASCPEPDRRHHNRGGDADPTNEAH
jgi:hypothetical protein